MIRNGGSPVWLARWASAGPVPRYVSSRTIGDAVRTLEAYGLPAPARIDYAGYAADPFDELSVLELKSTTKSTTDASIGRRAEAALSLYAILRIDWPIGSILGDLDAATRWKASNASLRDFVANVGAAIARLEADPRTLIDVVDASGLATWWRALEINARRRRNARLEARAAERRELYRNRARRLRRRVDYATAVGELDAALEGRLERDLEAAEAFRLSLIRNGFPPDDAESFAKRFARVGIPRL